jgi:hypothetical protein
MSGWRRTSETLSAAVCGHLDVIMTPVTMFAELLLPVGMSVDRDEVEDSLRKAFGDRLEVTGAGTGALGSNLDLDMSPDIQPDDLIAGVRGILAALGVIGGKVRIEGTDRWADV